MDLSQVKPGHIKVDIRHPGSNAPTGLVLMCISPLDEAFQPTRRMLLDKARQRRSVEQQEADNVQYLAGLVTSWEWRGDATWDGQKLPFSSDNVRMVLSASWLRLQVDEAVGRFVLFFSEVTAALSARIRHNIRYRSKDEKGETRLQRNARFGVASPPEPEVPPEAGYIWDWFGDINAQRQHSMDGPQPFEFREMLAWARMGCHVVRGNEWAVLRELDRVYREAIEAERSEAPPSGNGAAPPTKSGRENRGG